MKNFENSLKNNFEIDVNNKFNKGKDFEISSKEENRKVLNEINDFVFQQDNSCKDLHVNSVEIKEIKVITSSELQGENSNKENSLEVSKVSNFSNSKKENKIVSKNERKYKYIRLKLKSKCKLKKPVCIKKFNLIF